ncbi:uncharacterized protein SAPINGB_P002570 [Magnusiomyces paraingens]|uniref:TRIP4/RQT4 C2HC5-type zinc finger domain-containing protein n=1 Tax=Magnusiomyces paraingens TaxID=2606893 RepID=A0A5E8BEV1_9ASCO|nr:uncharacterized protein SAPINGB_P002570 [Saprochaete ingens]VVT50039.1 unnamed protein product [Saprochaete ingens]
MLQKKILVPKRQKKTIVKKEPVEPPKPTNCRCNARIHPLDLQMPNCLNCGFVLCVRNTTGFCPSCQQPLSKYASADTDEDYSRANSTLTRLLSYQRSSALRTQIIDQVSDHAPVSQWASPEEQAAQARAQAKSLRRVQQQQARENGRGRQVVSISLRGNKVIVEESKDDPEDYDDDDDNFGKEDLGQTPIQPIDFEKDPEYVADPDAGKDNKKRSRPLIKPVYFGNTRDPGPEIDEVASGEPSRLQQNEDYSTQRVWEM